VDKQCTTLNPRGRSEFAGLSGFPKREADMKMSETTATVTEDDRITIQVPADILAGEQQVLVVIDK
jgi:hypothetical protein